jgi:tetratricopeptide (TPR) repeat protein
MRKTLILSLIVALVAACSQTPQQKMQSLYATAEEQIDHYQFEKARVTIDKMGELDPGSPFVPYCTGLIRERQLSYQDAVHEYMMVGTVDPTFGPALEGICRAFATRAASDNAQQRPADPEARLLLARAMIGLGQYRGAEREIIKAQKLGTSSVLSDLMVARVLYLRNEIDSARSNRERVMADPQESVDFLMGAADLYETVGLIDSAITFGRRALESRPATFCWITFSAASGSDTFLRPGKR